MLCIFAQGKGWSSPLVKPPLAPSKATVRTISYHIMSQQNLYSPTYLPKKSRICPKWTMHVCTGVSPSPLLVGIINPTLSAIHFSVPWDVWDRTPSARPFTTRQSLPPKNKLTLGLAHTQMPTAGSGIPGTCIMSIIEGCSHDIFIAC